MRFTYKLFFIILSVLLFFVLSTFGSLAQTMNDPNTDFDANACFPNGSLYDTCNTRDADGDGDIDEHDQDWMWVCGWFLIRVEYGLFSDDILDGICLDIIIDIIEEEEEEKKRYKCQYFSNGWYIYKADSNLNGKERIDIVFSDPGLPKCASLPDS